MRLIDADKYEYPGDLINEPILTLDDIVPHGRWIAQNEGRTRFMCSNCESKNYGGHEKYCPNCGARMDLEEE